MKWLDFVILAVIFTVLVLGVVGQSDSNGSASTDPPTESTTSLSPEDDCALGNKSCDACVDRGVKCLWCPTNPGQHCIVYPVGQLIPHKDTCSSLSKARWGVCWMNYEALLICMGVIGGIILISFFCCIYCCCCKSKDNSAKYAREDAKWERERNEKKAKNDERRSERKERLDEIRRKYGLVKEDNPYDRLED